MINTLTRAMALGAVLTAAILASAAPAFSQAPSEAQREAIKSQCRSDYMAHCSSIPPGGEASLQCLQKNMASLAPGCQGAVKAVEAPKAEIRARDAEGGVRARSFNRQARGRSCRPQSSGGKAADQRAGVCDPQCLPLRLSQGLRGRADRRRPGAAMPGKE